MCGEWREFLHRATTCTTYARVTSGSVAEEAMNHDYRRTFDHPIHSTTAPRHLASTRHSRSPYDLHRSRFLVLAIDRESANASHCRGGCVDSFGCGMNPRRGRGSGSARGGGGDRGGRIGMTSCSGRIHIKTTGEIRAKGLNLDYM